MSLNDGISKSLTHTTWVGCYLHVCVVTVSCEIRQIPRRNGNLTMSLNGSVTEDLTHLEPENPSGHEKQ